MSDEWIENRSLRTRRPGDRQPQPASEPDDGPPSYAPRYVTETGELKPLTDEALTEIETLVEAYLSGDAPPGYQPELESVTGERIPLTQETLIELATITGRHKRPGDLPSPRSDETPGGDEPDLPPDFVPWFDTVTGEMPAILEDEEETQDEFFRPVEATPTDGTPRPSEEEIIDAEWVLKVGEELDTDHPLTNRSRRPGPVTMRLMEAIEDGRLGPTGIYQALKEGRLSRAQIGVIIAVAVLIGLLFFVPFNFDVIASMFEGGGGNRRIGGGVEPAPTSDPDVHIAPQPTVTSTATIEPTPTLAPTQRGRILFAANRHGNFDIFMMILADGSQFQLTTDEAADRNPVWSPDGERVLFVSDRSGDDDLFVVGLDPGEDPIQLTTSSASDRMPAWSADGERVVFVRETVDGAELMTFDAACMDEEPGACEDDLQLLSEQRYDLNPTWSPDGTQVAFGAADFPGQPAQIGILTLADDTYRALPGTGANDFNPAWSPAGEWIAFVSNQFEDYDLWVAPLISGDARQLTRSPGTDVQPAWSPNGDYIVYASDREGSDFELFQIRTDCVTGVVDDPASCEDLTIRLTNNDYDDLDPNWGP